MSSTSASNLFRIENYGGQLFCPEMAVKETAARVMKSLSGFRPRYEKLFFSHQMNNLLFFRNFTLIESSNLILLFCPD